MSLFLFFVFLSTFMQIINHFSIPFKVFEGSTYLGTALPTEEFCVPLVSYRWQQTHGQVFVSVSICTLCLLSWVHIQTQCTLLVPCPLSAVPLRSELSLQPITGDDADNQGDQFECSEGFSYEDVTNQQPETQLRQTCHRRGGEGGVLMVNMVPVKDSVAVKHTGGVGDNFDVPYVLHLWPSILLRNLLPYPISYKLKVWCVNWHLK